MAKKLTEEKAAKILHDNEIGGKKLTRKQQMFFGAKAGDKANNGVNMTGYLDGAPTANNPYNIIPGQGDGYVPITTQGMAFPIYANGQLLQPDTGNYMFPGNQVFETPAQAQNGAAINVEQGQQFNPWLYQDPYQQTPFPQQQMSYNTVDQNTPQQMDSPQPSSNYGSYIQKGAQFAGDVLDTIGGFRKSLIKGGASILNALIPDNQPKRDFVPITNYNRDAYGSQQYNNMFEQGGAIAKSGAVVTNYGYNDPIPGLTSAQEAALNQFVPYQAPQQQSTYNPPATPSYTSTGDQRDLFTRAYRNSAGRAQSGTNYSGHMWGDYSKVAPPLPGQNDPYGESYIKDPNGGFIINTNLAPTRFAHNTGQPYQMQSGGSIEVDSKNDPRYRAYQDSLSLYNLGKQILPSYEGQGVQPWNSNYSLSDYNNEVKTWGNEANMLETNKNSQTVKKLVSIKNKSGIQPYGMYMEEGTYPAFKKPIQQVSVRSAPQPLPMAGFYGSNVSEQPQIRPLQWDNVAQNGVFPVYGQDNSLQGRWDRGPNGETFFYPVSGQSGIPNGLPSNTQIKPPMAIQNIRRMESGGKIDKDGYQEMDLSPEQIQHFRSLGYDIQE